MTMSIYVALGRNMVHALIMKTRLTVGKLVRHGGELWTVLSVDRHFVWLEHFHSKSLVSVPKGQAGREEQ